MGYLTNETSNNKHVSSYIAKHDLRYVAKNIKMGSDMPFMKNFRDPTTGKISVTVENIDELKQRAPDWSRQVQLTAYLIRNPNHKFTTILAVVQPDWFNDLDSDNWQDGVALKNAIEFESLDEEGSIGLLNLDKATVDSFGDEWDRFNQVSLPSKEAHEIFEKYFSIFPWQLITENSHGFDLGCGSGRWAKIMVKRVIR